jgi:hypothetical protein
MILSYPLMYKLPRRSYLVDIIPKKKELDDEHDKQDLPDQLTLLRGLTRVSVVQNFTESAVGLHLGGQAQAT